jgi:ribonuclease P protein component
MLRRERRIHRAEEYASLRRNGRSVHGRMMTLNCARNSLPFNRYGIIVSKRVGMAVTRNRARRLLREAVRALDAELSSGFDIVLIARPALKGEPFAAVLVAVRELAIRAGAATGSGKLAP